jgi:uncharacterized protein YbjQ (UPF0145 family)
MPLPIFTVQTFNQNTLQPAGAVFAQRIESIQIARNFFTGTSNAAGGRSTMMEKKMNDLTTALLEALDQEATKKFPNAVALIDVNLHFSDMGKTDSNMFLAGQASATALIKRTKPASAQMASEYSRPVEQPVPQLPLAPQPLAPQPLAPQPLAPQPLAPRLNQPQRLNQIPLNEGPPKQNTNMVISRPIGGKRAKSRKDRK